jgi:L-asparaginase
MNQPGKIMKKKILLIHTGGTIGMTRDNRSGSIEPRLYESGNRLLEMGVISAGDMTFEATVTKLMFLLGQYDQTTLIQRNFQKSLAGEMTVLQ